MENGIENGLGKSIDDIITKVSQKIRGRLANTYGDIRLNNANTLLKYVALGGHGNYLEIGTLFGGSAIAVALLKNELWQDGMVVCIDPLDGYYFRRTAIEIDQSGFEVSPATLFYNIDEFGVGNRIMVVKSYSEDVYYLDMDFTVAYIDGDHHGFAPTNDWILVKDKTSKYVIFDNCDDKHSDVKRACRMAATDQNWEHEATDGISFVVRRK
jgi:predicted O-methyltransferase YrrM